MTEHRPSPEKLLLRAQKEERQEKRGKFKIYLGAAPGVGKTYSMLQDAIAQRARGLDVVVGVVETHGRHEIELLLKNLEILPRKKITYHEKEFLEFDLDQVLKRNPALILIDEMAHTNAPGSRHTKRWQDIQEILAHGIDVYTTLNVQHIESLNDVVAQIIHSRIKETVPDSIIELADAIELVDLPPEDLLRRLQEGKVYFPAQAELAKEHFFRKGNLIALREIALRVTAEQVGTQVLLYRQDLGIKHIWPTKEKILVCVGSSTESAKLIRAARRLSRTMQADWIGVHVDSPGLRLSTEQHNNAIQNLRLAEQLGAETIVLSGFDIVKEIMDFARERNITQIVIGKRIRSRWRNLLFKSLADEIVRYSEEIDVHIISEISEAQATKTTTLPKQIPWKIYGIVTLIIAATTGINFLLQPYLPSSNLIMIYLVAVSFTALLGSILGSVLASILSVLAFDFFFVPPYNSFAVENSQYLITLIVMLFVTQIISYLTIFTCSHARTARFAERRIAALYSLSRLLSSTRGVDKLLKAATEYLSEIFDSHVAGLLPEDNQLIIFPKQKLEPPLSEKEQSVAEWVYNKGQMAGLGTEKLPFSESLYIPLRTPQGSLGVLKVQPFNKKFFSPEQIHLLEACSNLIALSLEVDRIEEHNNILNSQMGCLVFVMNCINYLKK